MNEPTQITASRFPAWAGTAALVLGLTVIAGGVNAPLWWKNTRDLCDDALISARYAKNWADGAGLRYNLAPPDARPVEGYSNFLWVAGMMAGFKLHAPARLITAVMGGASSLLAVMALGLWVKSRTGSISLSLAAGLMLAANVPFAIWAVQGLETPLFALLALAAVAAARPDRPRPAEYLFALLAGLTRPDGLIVVMAIALVQALSPKRDLRRLAVIAGLCFALPYSIYLAGKLVHFGAVIPNTFFAKTGLGAAGVKVGLRYLMSASRMQIVPAIALAAGLIALRGSRRLFPLAAIGAAFLAGYGIFIVAVGGDFMPDHRFVMHLLPVMIGLAAIGLAEWAPRERPASRFNRICGGAGVPAAMVLLTVVMYVNQDYRLGLGGPGAPPSAALEWHHDQAKWYGRAAGWLARNAGREDVIAAGDIGYIGWVSGVDRVLDTNGLVDPYLARLPGAAALATDPEYVISQKPEFIVVMVHYFEDGKTLGHSAFDRSVLADPDRWLADYRLAAELPGWRSAERSAAGPTTHRTLIRFRIYRRT